MNIRFFLFLCSLLFSLSTISLRAQQPPQPAARQDTGANSNTAFIEILHSSYTDIVKEGGEQVTKIVGDVKLRNGSDLLYCDSAVLYQDQKIAEAFGNVSIEQADGTQAFADYLKYTGATKLVFMTGDVVLTDNKGNSLWSDEVTYDLRTKVGKYYKNGTLQNETTLLSSQYGEYNLKSKDARFRKDVVVNDPEYTVTSEDIGYNTDTRIVRFYAPAIVQNEETYLLAKDGTYDARNKIAKFKGRSNIIHNAQFIEADDLKYNKVSGWAVATGNVVAIDTAMHSTLYSGFAMYNEQTEKMIATDHPILKRKEGKDSIFVFSDTVFSEPIANLEQPDAGPIDTAKLQLDQLINQLQSGVTVDSSRLLYQQAPTADTTGAFAPELTEEHDRLVAAPLTDSIQTEEPILDLPDMSSPPEQDSLLALNPDTTDSILPVADSLSATTADARPQRPAARIGTDAGQKIYAQQPPADSTKPRYFIAYHKVTVYSDSAQAKCDSLRYAQSDSLMVLYTDPVIWGRQSQILGDTIYALLDSSKIQEVYVPKNAIMIQQNGPEQAGMFDQVQGTRMHAFFINNELDSAIVYPNAETIYFPKDDQDAYIGASQASSTRLRIQFKDRKIRQVHYLTDFKQTMSPMQMVEPQSLRLSRFRWRASERPQSLASLLEQASPFQRAQILGIQEQPDPLPATESTTPKQQKKKPHK